jgi:hypothetical protein
VLAFPRLDVNVRGCMTSNFGGAAGTVACPTNP